MHVMCYPTQWSHTSLLRFQKKCIVIITVLIFKIIDYYIYIFFNLRGFGGVSTQLKKATTVVTLCVVLVF